LQEIPTSATLEGIKGLPRELGTFSVDSLYVRYNFSRDELLQAFYDIPETDELPEPLKTVVHESTHLFHTISTPFGFLIYALRRLQATLIINTINRLRFGYQVKVKYPLVDFVLQLPRHIQSDVGWYLQAWHECELFVTLSLDSPDKWGPQLTKNPFLLGLSHSVLFSRVQRHLATHYREQARKFRADPAAPDSTLPFASFVPDEFDPERSGKDDRNMMAMQMLNSEANMIAIMESAATVAEFWQNIRLNREQFFHQIHARWAQQGLTLTSGFLRGTLNARRAEEYVLSFTTLCDLALFGPVLPHHRHLRQGDKVIYEVMPFFRMLELMHAAHQIRPMESLQDHERYTTELCQALGWVTPTEITNFTAQDHVPMEHDNLELVYLISSHYRKSQPWIFQDYTFHLVGNNDAQRQFLFDFNFPVIQYRDETVYTRYKAVLVPLTRFHLLRSALRAILFKNHVSLKMPYRPKNPEEVSFLKETLLQDLELTIGHRIKNLTLN
jgi:hypothetical protein